MRNFATLILLSLVATASNADVFLGELSAGKCTEKKKVTLQQYVREAFGDKKLEVTHDKEGQICGEGIYIRNLETKRRWATFGTKENCECYLRSAQALDRSK